MYTAIGRLVSVWALCETALAHNVARLVATTHDLGASSISFHPGVYQNAAMVALGSNVKATLMQIENLCRLEKAEIRRAANVLHNIGKKRNVVAHCAIGNLDGQQGFLSIGAARQNLGSALPYTAEDLSTWSEQVKEPLREIDRIVTMNTRFSYDAIREHCEEWTQHQIAAARQTLERLNRQDSDL